MRGRPASRTTEELGCKVASATASRPERLHNVGFLLVTDLQSQVDLIPFSGCDANYCLLE